MIPLALETVMHVFVVPPGEGAVTGGHLYNTCLVDALSHIGFPCVRIDCDGACSLPNGGGPRALWIDTLYLEQFARLRARHPAARVGLLVHYLPALARAGDAPDSSALSTSESSAIGGADAFIVTSHYMANVLRHFGAGERPIAVVEPATLPDAPRSRRDARGGTAAVMIANVVEAKGILPFLQALALRLRLEDPFELSIVGSRGQDAAYANACDEIVQRSDSLRGRVTFMGTLPHRTSLEKIAAGNLFVSTSKMESFGMALAEARSAGIPIVARRGGNARAHISAEAGGRLLDTEDEVAAECIFLARNPGEHARRLHAARRARVPAYTWKEAAASFVAQLGDFDA